MLGICASVQPLTRTVGPTIGGVLYKHLGVSSFGYLQLIVNIGLFVYLLKSNIPLAEMKNQWCNCKKVTPFFHRNKDVLSFIFDSTYLE